ncbi:MULTISPECIES: TlpA disulfide reductase family protein [unclassified Streptomyces]|uniref:TlpA family protein disulfide reductase n=1 Tax=unclassified Streptomyces TaxID=2593676 RepID=UPI00225B6068|nr:MULTISPECIES: TlpA disulfide reductase family protein [unclassified Streptomyces]MCX5140986.1 TlpA family protein disulfide reductase [Streptomyces sp. NBC_00338]WSU59478.1 TlpA family protein disulfide reductase [Streptomyces sp. NBC_01104]
MSYGRASRRRFTLLAAPAAAAALALTLTACSSDNKTGGGGDTHFVTGSGGISTVARGERAAAPKLDGKSLEGKALNLADYKGKVVVLNAWGSWCGPCRAEAKHFAEVAADTEGQGVQFLGINTRDPERAQAVSFEQDFGVTYPSFYDPTGKLMLRFPKGTLRPQTIPSTVVIDRDGKIAARSLAALDATKLRKMIDPLIAEK